MCLTIPNDVVYSDFVESQHKDIQTVQNLEEITFNIYSMLKLRLQNSMVAIHPSALKTIKLSPKFQMKYAMKFWKPNSVFYAPLNN